MRKTSLLFLFGFFFPLLCFSTFPKRPSSYVTDAARLLDESTRSQIESICVELEQKTSAELAVVTVRSLDGRDIESYANELFKAWGIGKKGKDNGVLYLVAPQERNM